MAAEFQHKLKDTKNSKDINILEIGGDIDESNQKELDSVMKKLLKDKEIKYLVLDLQGLEYINSGVIGLLASLHTQFIDADKDFVFAAANDHIFDIIDLVGLTTVITLFETVEEACVSFED